MSSIEDLLSALQRSSASQSFAVVDVAITTIVRTNKNWENFLMEGAKLPTHPNSDLILAGKSHQCDLGLICVQSKWCEMDYFMQRRM
jgi:hypothetical protein